MTRLATLKRLPSKVRKFLTRGRALQARLDEIDSRIAVTGTRGKSTTTTWLYEALEARDLDVYAKVTGEQPHSLYDGDRHPIERDGPVKLYENEREIQKFAPQDAIVVENQGIHKYTTRIVNTDYVDPTIIVLTNVRRDHLDTLGRNRSEIARAFARSIPPETHVISGEANEGINEYLEHDLQRRGAALTRAVATDSEIVTPADELITLVEAVLRTLGVEPLTPDERALYRERLTVQWIDLPKGRLYDAANANDVESTEVIRRVLMDEDVDHFRPLVYFRRDRPGRTASFIEYLNSLAEAGLIDEVHGVGAHRGPVMNSLEVPVTWYDDSADSPVDVLDDVLEAGQPVIVMGNVVPEFMQELQKEIRRRAAVRYTTEGEEQETKLAVNSS